MNAISKRLLSWLCVIAMVLSMAPVLDLSSFAVTTKAAEEAIVYGSANYDGVDEAILEQMEFGNAIDNSDAAFAEHLANNTCPVCGDLTGDQVWTKVSNATDQDYANSKYHGQEAHTGLKLHIYYDDTVTKAKGNMIGFAEKAKTNSACIWIKSTQSITNHTTRAVMLGNDNVINFFGQGMITTDVGSTSFNMFQVSGGTLNLYGGNFVFVHPQNDFRQAAIRVSGTSAVINIFDGVKIGPETQDTTKVTQNVQYTSGGTVNMFGGEIRNGVSPAWGYSGNVTVSSSGKFNMYGGTISGGTFLSTVTENVTVNATIGGNVMVGGKNQAAYYDATTDETTGETTYKANYTCSAGTFNMYGGLVTGGKANNGGNGGGNIQIYHTSAVMNMQGGTVTAGYAMSHGGNFQINGGTLNVSGTALISDSQSLANGGNIHMNHASGDINISGGKITGGKANNGGNIYVDKAGSFVLSGGIIDGGDAAGSGGNLYLASEAEGKVTISGGTFQNGVAENSGGNIGTAVTLTLSDAILKDGTSRTGGGNIKTLSRNKKLTLNNCTVSGGWVTGAWDEATETYKPTGANWGGNISAWVCDVEINGGLYYNGYRGPEKSGHQGNNIACLSSVEKTATSSLDGCTLTISGDAVVVGDVNVSGPSSSTDGNATSPGTTLVLKDAPQIVSSYELNGETVKASYGGVNLPAAVQADIDDLSEDAAICLTTAEGRVITKASENAANVAGCFSVYGNAGLIATVNDSNQLVISEKPVEKPEKPAATVGGQNLTDEVWETMLTAEEIQEADLGAHVDAGTCPICGDGITWVEATKPGQIATANEKLHYYMKDTTTVSKTWNWGFINAEGMSMCFALLNGAEAKNIGGAMGIRNGAKNCTFNIMGDGIIYSDNSSNTDLYGTLEVQGSGNTLNLYGGTFYYNGNTAKADGTLVAAAALDIAGSGNTVNIYDGVTIGPETQDLTKECYNVRLQCATANTTNTLNIYGGTIKNGVTARNNASGNITTAYTANCTTAINIYGGSIVNGSHTEAATTTYGGNIFAAAYTKINMYGGTISGGEAKYGGNVYMSDSQVSTFNMHGGTLSGGEATTEGGNLITYNKNVNIGQYGLIEDGEAGVGGGNISIKKYSVTTAGHILNGKAGNRGGNIDVNANAVVVDGGIIANGTLTAATTGAHWGCNIRSWNGKVTINDGLIYGGKGAVSNVQSNNIGALGDTSNDTTQPELTINGGTIIGDISTSTPSTKTTTDEETGVETTTVFLGTKVTLSGSPKILMSKEIDGVTVKPTAGYGLNLASGIEMDITNLNADAEIALTSAKGRVISAAREDAEAVAGCFTVENVAGVIVAKNADNKLYITAPAGTVVDAQGNETAYAVAADALADYDYDTDLYIILSGDVEIDKNIKLNVKDGTVNLSGSGNVELIDTANKNFEDYGAVTISGEVTINNYDVTVGGDRYITLKDGTNYSAHYVEMKLTHVTLRTTEAGLYYKASIKCDDTLAGRVLGYGVVLSTANMPGADFMTETGDINDYTMIDGPLAPDAETHTATTTSGGLFGILKDPTVAANNRTADENVAAAQTNVYANLYLAVDKDGEGDFDAAKFFMGDTENEGSTTKGTFWNLLGVMEAINDGWASYNETQQILIKTTVEKWAGWITEAAQTEWAGKFSNILA